MQQGAIGINLGRNIWQSEHPVPMIRALRHVVHENGSVQAAVELFKSLATAEATFAAATA